MSMDPKSLGIVAASSLISFITGVLVTKVYQERKQQQQQPINNVESKEKNEVEDDSDDSDDSDYELEEDKSIGACKMVLIVRTDLEMTKGKIAAQCCHGTLGAYKRAKRNPKYEKVLKQWEYFGQAKITCKVDNEKDLLDLEKLAKEVGLPHYLVIDAGRTQIASGSCTVLAVGPAPVAEVDKVTKKLRLL